jgi:hypothetical protein
MKIIKKKLISQKERLFGEKKLLLLCKRRKKRE